MKRPIKLGALVQFRIPEGMGAKIDEWRRVQPDIPTRSEAIRRLVERGLKTSG